MSMFTIFAVSDNTPITLALIAIVGTVITALFKLLNDNTTALTNLATTTETGNREARERNGHLGEQNIQIATLITSQNQDVASIKASTTQTAANTERIEVVLNKSAVELARNTSVVAQGTEAVAAALIDHDAAPQIISEQHVKKQIIDHKE